MMIWALIPFILLVSSGSSAKPENLLKRHKRWENGDMNNNGDMSNMFRGTAGVDYPNYKTVPNTSFRCDDQIYEGGLYADVEAQCQVYHVCHDGRKDSFLCGRGTIFNQEILACDYWYSTECDKAPSFYYVNQQIGNSGSSWVPPSGGYQPDNPSNYQDVNYRPNYSNNDNSGGGNSQQPAGFGSNNNGQSGGFDPNNNGQGGGFGSNNNGQGGGFDPNNNGQGGGFGSNNNGQSGGFDPNNNGQGGGFGSNNNGQSGGFDPNNNGQGGRFGSNNNGQSGGFDPNNNGQGGGFGSNNNGQGGGLGSNSNNQNGGFGSDNNGQNGNKEDCCCQKYSYKTPWEFPAS